MTDSKIIAGSYCSWQEGSEVSMRNLNLDNHGYARVLAKICRESSRGFPLVQSQWATKLQFLLFGMSFCDCLINKVLFVFTVSIANVLKFQPLLCCDIPTSQPKDATTPESTRPPTTR